MQCVCKKHGTSSGEPVRRVSWDDVRIDESADLPERIFSQSALCLLNFELALARDIAKACEGPAEDGIPAAWPWTLQRFREEMRTPEFRDFALIE